MWFLGMIAGLFIGALAESVPAALILAVVGAFAVPKIIGKKTAAGPARSEAESAQPSSGAAAPPAGGMPALQQRVAELEQRVSLLEQRLAQGASSAVAVPARQEIPIVQSAPVAARPAAVADAGVAAAHVPVPEIGPAAVRPPPEPVAPVAAKPPTAEPAPPRRLPPPPPPPPVPWRDRLPAPIANLIFGGNMLVKLGVLILFLGLAFLLRYTAERVTVPVELRYAAVALVGAGLLALGWLLRRKRAGYALILQGAGIGVFYLTTLAAMKVQIGRAHV